uniref:Uncharacterized protein n=1 Tax=Mycena chlorophos TaxID=658473 RepID=A0ABQ0LPH8_MYCCL|nr:predicted protein [Mycena chlorophos]
MAPGANYMGGRRNAARTRSKDTVGRAQKNHFHRQRLDVLSNGLSRAQTGRAPSVTSGYGPKATAEDIGLSHAPGHGRRQVLSEINEASARSVPRQPPSRSASTSMKANEKDKDSSPGSKSATSRVLDALDSIEPISMRSVRSRILSIPDLAGLSSGFGHAVDPLHTRTPERKPAILKRPLPTSPSETDSSSFLAEKETRKLKRMRRMEEPSPFVHRFDPLEGFDTSDEEDPPEFMTVEQEPETEPDMYRSPKQPIEDVPVHSRPSSRSSSITCFGVEPEYSVEHRVAEALLKDLYNPSFAQAYPQLPIDDSRPAFCLSTNSAGFNDPPRPRIATLQDQEDDDADDMFTGVSLYDFADPWNAIGAFLGLENPCPVNQTDDDAALEPTEDELDGVGGVVEWEDEADQLMGDAIPQERLLAPSPQPDPEPESFVSPVLSVSRSEGPPHTHIPAPEAAPTTSRVSSPPPYTPLSPRSQIRTRFPISSAHVTPPRSRLSSASTTYRAPIAQTLLPDQIDDSDSESDKENENDFARCSAGTTNTTMSSSRSSLAVAVPNSPPGIKSFYEFIRSDDDDNFGRRIMQFSLSSPVRRAPPSFSSSSESGSGSTREENGNRTANDSALFCIARRSSPISASAVRGSDHEWNTRTLRAVQSQTEFDHRFDVKRKPFEKFPSPSASQAQRGTGDDGFGFDMGSRTVRLRGSSPVSASGTLLPPVMLSVPVQQDEPEPVWVSPWVQDVEDDGDSLVAVEEEQRPEYFGDLRMSLFEDESDEDCIILLSSLP